MNPIDFIGRNCSTEPSWEKETNRNLHQLSLFLHHFHFGVHFIPEVSSNHIIAHYMESHQPNTAYIVLYVNVSMYIYNIIYNMIWVINHLLHLGPAEAGKWVHIFKHDYDRWILKLISHILKYYAQYPCSKFVFSSEHFA